MISSAICHSNGKLTSTGYEAGWSPEAHWRLMYFKKNCNYHRCIYNTFYKNDFKYILQTRNQIRGINDIGRASVGTAPL
jgi:hypothetical protein